MTELVRGEAPESDEELTDGHPLPKQLAFTATEMPGEATESEEEIFDQPTSNPKSTTQVQPYYKSSLLKKKLMENNVSIQRNLNAIIKTQFASASKELHAADQLLMKSQLTLQSVTMSIKTTKSNLRQLLASVSNVCTANFIPDLKPWTFQVKVQTEEQTTTK